MAFTTTTLDYYTRASRSTGAVALAETLAPAVPWVLLEIRVHLSAAGGAGNLTLTLDHSEGSEYDCVLKTENMTAVTDLYWQPAYPLCFAAGDELDITWANAGGKTYGLEVIYREWKF